MKKKVINDLINISRISRFVDKSSRMKLVHGLILSKIDFCNSLYYGLPSCDLKALQMLLNAAARVVAGISHLSRERVTPICIELHFLPMKARIKYKLCVLVFKALTTGEPRYLADLLRYRKLTGNRSLRSSNDNRLEEPRLSCLVYIERSFKYSAPRIYNSLANYIRECDDLIVFKRKLKTFLFTDEYDSDRLQLKNDYAV